MYAVAFGAAFVLSLVLTPLARVLAARFDVLDHPGGYKCQTRPIPYLGGAAIAASVVAAVAAAGLVGPGPTWGQATAILGLSAVLAVVGLADDVRSLPPLPRLIAQIVAALVVILVGTRVQLFDSAVVEVALTMIWVVGITNGLNLLDNMDGLAGGVGAVAAFWLFVMAAGNGQFLVAALTAALFGAAVGFLRYNVHPATIYMGDTGSLFLGFLLAVAAIRLRFDAPIEYTWPVPVVALGVPLLDTSYVTVTRLMAGRNPLSGGRDHISHRLVALGLSVRGAVLFHYLAAFVFGFLAWVVSRTADGTAYLIVGSAFGVCLLALARLDRLTSSAVEVASGHAVQEETG